MMVEAIVGIVGPSRTLGCVVELGSELSIPGIVRRNTERDKSWFGFGSLDPSTAGREEEVAEFLRHVATVDTVPDILSTKWMKLAVNAMILAPMAILGLPTNEALEVPGMRALMLRLGAEDVVDPDTLPGVLMDHLKGRKTEARLINRLVAAELERLGTASSVNATVRRAPSGSHKRNSSPRSPTSICWCWSICRFLPGRCARAVGQRHRWGHTIPSAQIKLASRGP